MTFLQETPPPWIPAVTQHTTDGATEKAELHMVRAVDTGVINVRFPFAFIEATRTYDYGIARTCGPRI